MGDLKEKREARRHHSKIYEAWEGNFKKKSLLYKCCNITKKINYGFSKSVVIFGSTET